VTYTELSVVAVLAAVVLDLLVLRTKLLRRKVFWVSYPILLFFQLLTNAVLAGTGTVRYDGADILGPTVPAGAAPPFLGSGRIAYAPVEDVLFGFALVLLTLTLWVAWGRLGLQRTPYPGPPRVAWFSPRRSRDRAGS
jgi:lycopene cyclase domain-containing protein